MAIRTSDAQVRSILDVDSAGDNLVPYITVASDLVDEQCVDSGYDDTRLEMIERYLSAHFYAINKRRTLQQGVAQAVNQTFDRVEVDLYLYNTVFGQHAMALDTAGNLAGLINSLMDVKKPLGPPKKKVRWLGSVN